jgi:hypothetical protein
MTGQDAYTIRQATYELCKLCGKNLAVRPGKTRRCQIPRFRPAPSLLLALRGHVTAPIHAGVRSPRMGREPAHWTDIDRDYETLRIGMQALFRDLSIEPLWPHRQHFADRRTSRVSERETPRSAPMNEFGAARAMTKGTVDLYLHT